MFSSLRYTNGWDWLKGWTCYNCLLLGPSMQEQGMWQPDLAVESGEVSWLYWPIPSFRLLHIRLSGCRPENMQLPYFRDQHSNFGHETDVFDQGIHAESSPGRWCRGTDHWNSMLFYILCPSMSYATQILLQWILLTQLLGLLLAVSLQLPATSGITYPRRMALPKVILFPGQPISNVWS